MCEFCTDNEERGYVHTSYNEGDYSFYIGLGGERYAKRGKSTIFFESEAELDEKCVIVEGRGQAIIYFNAIEDEKAKTEWVFDINYCPFCGRKLTK